MPALARRMPARPKIERSPQQQQLDTRAIELSSQAIGRLDDHQRECRDRYLEHRDQLGGVAASIESLRKEREDAGKSLYTAVIRAAGALILTLLTGIGALALVLLQHH